MSKAEPMTPAQVKELRGAIREYDQAATWRRERDAGERLCDYMADHRHAILASLDHYHAMIRRMGKEPRP